MAPGHRIPWSRLVLGGLLALSVAAVLMTLVGPLLAVRVLGGGDYQIRDEAMAPVLLTGDWVLAEPLERDAVPQRGTIVVYRSPVDPGGILVSRVIGLPGETVQMRGGAVYVDGRRAEMEPMPDRVIRKRPPARRSSLPVCVNEPVEINGACHQEMWRETLPDGTTTLVLNTRNKMGLAKLTNTPVRTGQAPVGGDDTPLVRVPGNAVFVLGDNRDHSLDSRVSQHGTVPVRDLLHRVWLVHSSLDKSSRFFRPRWDRFFRKVR